jgi:hypothetical protein
LISPRLLQQLENSFLRPLRIIFNMSLESGTVPTAWKTATVTPIFKKGTKGDPGNYRPVSLTSVPCKILESIIKDKVMDHLLENNLISDSQHGFMPGRSCATNLVEFMDFVTESVDEGESVDIFYQDLAKAFDKVPRQQLLRKLRAKSSGTRSSDVDRGSAHRSNTVHPNTRRKIRRVQCRIRCTAGDCARPMPILRLYR